MCAIATRLILDVGPYRDEDPKTRAAAGARGGVQPHPHTSGTAVAFCVAWVRSYGQPINCLLSFDWTGAGGHCYLLLLVAYLFVVISPISFVDFNQEYNGAIESPPLNNIF